MCSIARRRSHGRRKLRKFVTCVASFMQRPIHMASTKLGKTAVKMKTSRKDPAVVPSESVPVNGHAGEIKAEVSIKQAAGINRAIMSFAPPTGQPLKPTGKSPRIADSARPRRLMQRLPKVA
jgi:hypothetical protein